MLSKAKIKYIRSLELKKNRREERVFVAEGHKLVGDLYGYFPCKLLLALPEWLKTHPMIMADEVIEVTYDELSKVSLLKTPQEVLAVFGQKEVVWDSSYPKQNLCLALDDVQDPGNLGTIIRLADWFGIEHIFCSLGTVDMYSPKVVQASMGALARVSLHYGSLTGLLALLDEQVPVYGTFLDGGDMYRQPLSRSGLIVMGNEGNGISAEVAAFINRRLYIPNYPADRKTSESLNVAMATAIVCAEFRRRTLSN